MKIIFVLSFLVSMACNTSKESTTKKELISYADSSIMLKQNDSSANLPACIKALIEKMKTSAVTNPPSKLYSYTFEGKTVFYVPAVCCDQFSNLYNDSCKIIAHPDGGFTGRGDKKLPTFNTTKTNEKLIWEDKRTR